MRRRWTCSRLLPVAVVATTALLLTACDWPGYRLGPARTSSNDAERTLAPGNVATLVQRYAVPIGANGTPRAPVVAGGTVYVATTSGGAGTVQAFRASDGARRWSRPVDGYPTDPTTAPGLVIVGLGNSVLALRASTGAVAWQTPTAGFVSTSPAVDEGRVYFSAADGSLETQSSQGALDAETGTPVWTRSFAEAEGGAGGVTVGDGRVYFTTFDRDALIAVRQDDGATVYDLTSGAPSVTSLMAFRDGVLYLTRNNEVVEAKDAATGTLHWASDSLGRGSDSSPAVTADTVFACRNGVGPGGAVSFVQAHDRATGAERWHKAMWCDSLVHANGVVYVASLDTLRMLDATSGDELASWTLGGNLSDPIVAGGSVYVVVADPSRPNGRLARFDLP